MFVPVITVPLPVNTSIIFQESNWRQLCRLQLHAKWIFWYLYCKMGGSFLLNSNIIFHDLEFVFWPCTQILPCLGTLLEIISNCSMIPWISSRRSEWDLRENISFQYMMRLHVGSQLNIVWGGGGTLLWYKIYLSDHSFDCLKKFICHKHIQCEGRMSGLNVWFISHLNYI